MGKGNAPIFAFNRGEVSKLALARVELDRVAISAESMINWIPKTLGPMTIRPGLGYKGSVYNDAAARIIPFLASTLTGAMLELTANKMRVWLSGVLVSRASVATSIATLTSSAGWTDSSANGGTLTFAGTGLTLNPNSRGGIARCTRQITVAGGDLNVEHSLKIIVPSGWDSIQFKVGSAAQGEQYIRTTRLLAGEHHLTFTPTGDFHLTFEVTHPTGASSRVTSIAVEASGNLEVATPWGASDIPYIQYDQSADVMFVACNGIKRMRVERRSSTSWSVVEYYSVDGPFLGKTADISLTPGATYGRTTLTASQAFFKSTHVGALFRLFHDAQAFRLDVSGAARFTDPIRVAGINGTNSNERAFSFTIAGTWSGTLVTQRSILGPDTGFGDYPRDAGVAATIDITGNATYNNEDEDDNLIAWYRMGFKTGDYTSGIAQVTVNYPFGGDFGVVRVVGYTSATQVDVIVERTLRGTDATTNWAEGSFSDAQAQPTSVALFEGRLWWFGGSFAYGSVVDNFESFDQEEIGDSGPVIRSIGSGPIDVVNWAVALENLLLGTTGAEYGVRSSSLDEPVTPSNMTIKPTSGFGSKSLFPAAKVDERVLFVQRNGKAVIAMERQQNSFVYGAVDLTLLHPDVCSAGVVAIAVQRQPDTRIHIALSDGTVALLTYNPAEQITCWSKIEIGGSGIVESIATLPSTGEDEVYYVVKRTVNGNTKRYLEKWALESEVIGGTLCKLADSFITYTGVSTVTITGLSHLEGKTVVAWANSNVVEESNAPKTFVVSGGQITLPSAATNVVVGLPYNADYISTKLAYAAQAGTALTMTKRVDHIGLILANAHHRGLKLGKDFNNLTGMPQVYKQKDVVIGTIYSTYDYEPQPFKGSFDSDSRVYMRGQAPYPMTIQAAIVGLATNDKI